MEFQVLGPVEITDADRPVDAGHARQRAVLAVLLLDLGRVVPADRLIDHVWGEDPPSVRNALYGYIARLRTILGNAADDGVTLSRRSGGYLLQANPEHVDLHRFRSLVGQAAAAGDDDAACVLLREALALWRGPALAGLDSPWLNAMRDTLELERHAALLDLNDTRLRLGEHAALVSDLSSQAAANPADERLIGQLMLALYRSGRQADALRWFEQTRRYLAGELGADPAPPLRELHQQVLRADPALTLPCAVTTAQRAAPVPRELPADVAAFTGRSAELAALDELLLGTRQTTAAVISAVSGTAGVGKTALAVHWAHRAAGHFPDGQLHVDLRGYDPGQPVSAGDALVSLLRALGVPGHDIPAAEADRSSRYRSLLAGKQMLILLDNAGTVDQVRPLLPGTSSCAVLVTSRDSLAGLVARNGARRLDLDLLPLSDAVQLLRELIGAAADADPGATTELAEQCARLPLALRIAAELAASRPAAPLSDLVAELGDQQQRLEVLHAGGDPRSAVRAVFSWSYDHLDELTARAFRLAGLHPAANFEEYAVAALTGANLQETRRALDALTRAHLIQNNGLGRYSMHDLLRGYARAVTARVDGPAGERCALTRLFDYYVHACATAMDTLYPAQRERRPRVDAPASPAASPANPAAARAWLDAERPHLVAMAACAAQHGWPQHATRLAATLALYLDASGCYVEANSIHGHARDAARQDGDQLAEARALNGLGGAAYYLGDYPAASACYRQAASLFGQQGDSASKARVLQNLALLDYGQGCYDSAVDLLQQALSLHRENDDRVGQASALDILGVVTKRQGRYELALAQHEQALALYRDAGDLQGQASVLNNLGVLSDLTHRQEQAYDYFRQALALYRQTGHRRGEAITLANIGDFYRQQGRYDEAADILTEALELYSRVGNLLGELQARIGIAEVLLAAGQPGRARAHYAGALGRAVRIGDQHEQARALDGLGQAFHVSGDLGRAREHWQQALDLFTRMGAPEADEVRARLVAVEAREHAGA